MVFHGRTNSLGDDGAGHIVRPFRQCTQSWSRLGLINHVHYDSRPVQDPLPAWGEDLLRGAGCPRYRDGGRVDLFAALRMAVPDGLIIADAHRVSPRTADLPDWHREATGHDVVALHHPVDGPAPVDVEQAHWRESSRSVRLGIGYGEVHGQLVSREFDK
ncbi:hypothetical protein GCM10025787_60670 [Saccharopolyspora rosea]